MTNLDPASHGGTYVTCEHRTGLGGFCRRCDLPLHTLNLGSHETIQFSDAVSLVAYARANYNHQRTAILATVGQ